MISNTNASFSRLYCTVLYCIVLRTVYVIVNYARPGDMSGWQSPNFRKRLGAIDSDHNARL